MCLWWKACCWLVICKKLRYWSNDVRVIFREAILHLLCCLCTFWGFWYPSFHITPHTLFLPQLINFCNIISQSIQRYHLKFRMYYRLSNMCQADSGSSGTLEVDHGQSHLYKSISGWWCQVCCFQPWATISVVTLRFFSFIAVVAYSQPCMLLRCHSYWAMQ